MITIFLAFLAGGPQADSGATFGETIVVTAERERQPLRETTAAITVLTRADIDRAPATTLAEILPAVPGLDVLFAHPVGGTPIVGSRGFFGGGEVEYVQLLVDGVPAGDAESGLAQWRQVGAEEIERIEVLRGPGSAFYGDTALGGVVQVFTRRGLEEGRSIVGVDAGSFGSRNLSVRSGSRIGATEVVVHGALSRTAGYRRHSGGDEARADLTLRRPTAGTLWSVAGNFSTRDREEPGPMTFEELRNTRSGGNAIFDDDRDESRRARLSLAYETSAIRILVHGARRESDTTRTLLLAPGFGDRASRSLDTTSLGASALAAIGAFRVGMDAGRDRVHSRYGTSPLRSSRRKAAAFVTHDLPLGSRTRMAAGVRFDSIDDAGSERTRHRAWSPRIGVNFQTGRYSAFAQWSRAFKAPTLDQLFDARPFPDFAGSTFTISNPRLSPQRARNLEAGLARQTSTTRFDVAAYHMRVDDEIDFDPATFRYANIGHTIHRGIEALVSLRRTSSVAPFFTYTLTDVSPVDGPNEGEQLKNIPRHVLRGGVNLRISEPVSIQIAASRKSGRYLDDAHRFPLENATVIDVRGARRIGPHRVIIDLLNLTSERYSEVGFALPDFEGAMVPHYFPAPGFGLRVGFEARF